MKNYPPIIFSVLFAICGTSLVSAQDENPIVIQRQAVGFGQKPIPVSLEGFSGEVQRVLEFDLYVQGFSFVTPDQAQYDISGSNGGNVIGKRVRLAQLCRLQCPPRGARVCR